ncbi:MAG TPA: hypothetical protein VGH19_09765 [Verrucomicrobiae bacterium]
MRTNCHFITPPSARNSGLVLLELLVVAAVVILVFMLVIPAFYRPRVNSTRIKCSSNLKQIALSYKMYAGDHDGRMPWHEPALKSANPQTVRSLATPWQYFLAASNELGSTKILACPADDARWTNRADTFTGLTNSLILRNKRNQAISYFINPQGDETKPNMLLTGDRHITPDGQPALYQSPGNQLAEVNTNLSQWWKPKNDEFHESGGNYALYDGSVQQASTDRLREALRLARDSYGTNANRFLFPQ